MVDRASGYTHVELQAHLNSHETLQAVAAYKKFCATYSVVPQQFLSDNGSSFTSEEFKKHLEQFAQSQRHSGVGAHHSNEITE